MVCKLAEEMQFRWFHFLAEHPYQQEDKAFEAWLDKENRAAVKYHQQMIPVAYGGMLSEEAQWSASGRSRYGMDSQQERQYIRAYA